MKRLKNSSRFNVVVAFCCGFVTGIIFLLVLHDGGPAPSSSLPRTKRAGGIQHISQVPIRATSHSDVHGNPITKQQLVEPFEILNIAGLSVATLKPGQTIANHSHESMLEVFFVLSGRGTIVINDVPTSMRAGTFAQVVPGERHSLSVDAKEEEGMAFLVLGVAEKDLHS